MTEDADKKILVEGIVFGEGPRWHAGHFHFSDIGGKHVQRVTDSGELETIVRVPGRPSGLGWRPDGTLLVVSMHDHRLMGFEGARLREVADLSAWCGGDLNDMVVDAQGRAYVGNIGFDLERRPIKVKSTQLVRVDPDGSARAVAEDLVAPNGMVITPDGVHLIVAESGRACLTAFPVESNGDLGPRRISTGERPAIACMLGGPDRRTLYLITAPTMSIATSIPLKAGRIETIEVPVAGAGWP